MTEHLYLDTLSALLDGELETAQRPQAQAHLDGCAHCQARFAELRALGDDLRTLPRRARRVSRTRRLPLALGAAASLLLGMLLGSTFNTPQQPEMSAPALLAVLGSAPPGGLCARPEFCQPQGVTR
ncbi:MAG TPA: zf-HC2 domain-containing protein [Pseudomonas sp.]|jgi:anti-sigma factor RsiW|nr:zf-HC2 domain-containing protein [Pseudomonas sp.]